MASRTFRNAVLPSEDQLVTMKNLVIVGNAPLSINYSKIIEAADIVVRMNECKQYGGPHGYKSDIIYMGNTGSPALRFISERPFIGRDWGQQAEVLFVRDSLAHHEYFQGVKNRFPDYSESELDDLSDQIIEANQLGGRQVSRLSYDINKVLLNKLTALSEKPFICPSTGILAVEHILARPEFSNYRKHIVGFGFKGWSGHPWLAEKALIAGYVLTGRLSFYPV